MSPFAPRPGRGSGHRAALLADAALSLAAVPAVAGGAYLAGLAALSAGRVRPVPTVPGRPLRLTVVVPAHDEEHGIAETVKSVLATDYPDECRRVLVIADNCTDQTAAAARSAGADVIERHDDTRRSKGYALADVLPALAEDPAADGVIVVDADTTVSENLLAAVDTALRLGAPAVQVAYGVRNPEAGWRTRLMAIALACFHDVRSLGRERLHLSCGLRGNGMAFSRDCLAAVPHLAHGLVEDAEHGITLGLSGRRVHYVHGARVLGEMPSAGSAAGSQRARWEGGRRDLRRRHAVALARAAVRRRDPVLADLAADVCLPPLGQLVAAELCGGALTLVAGRVLGRPLAARRLWGAALGGVALHVVQGWRLSGTGARGLADLAKAPAYVAWKLAGRAGMRNTASPTRPLPGAGHAGRTGGDVEWVRTTRESERAR